jgi:hypothetical protein
MAKTVMPLMFRRCHLHCPKNYRAGRPWGEVVSFGLQEVPNHRPIGMLQLGEVPLDDGQGKEQLGVVGPAEPRYHMLSCPTELPGGG